MLSPPSLLYPTKRLSVFVFDAPLTAKVREDEVMALGLVQQTRGVGDQDLRKNPSAH